MLSLKVKGLLVVFSGAAFLGGVYALVVDGLGNAETLAAFGIEVFRWIQSVNTSRME